MATPPARTASTELKGIMEALFPESFVQEVVGGGTNPSSVSAAADTTARPFVLTEAFMYDTRVVTANTVRLKHRNNNGDNNDSHTQRCQRHRRRREDTLVVYIDPAFSDSCRASASGIALCAAINDKVVLLGLERIEQASNIETVSRNIAAACVNVIGRVLTTHTTDEDDRDGDDDDDYQQLSFGHCLIAIERNLASSVSHAIAKAIRDMYYLLIGSSKDSPSLKFVHHRSSSSSSSSFGTNNHNNKNNGTIIRVGYLMGATKAHIFADMASLFNSGVLVASTVVQSVTMSQPVHELCDELEGIVKKPNGSYTGKVKIGQRDDLAVSFVMSCYFVLHRNDTDILKLSLTD